MAAYVALRYVGRWTPGEVVSGLTDEQARRLKDKGAIRELDAPESMPQEPDTPAEEPAEEPVAEAEEALDAPMEIDAADTLVTAPEAKKTRRGGKRK